MTMQRTLKLYKLPENTKVPGFRKLVYTDIPQAHKILTEVSARPELFDIFDRFATSIFCIHIRLTVLREIRSCSAILSRRI